MNSMIERLIKWIEWAKHRLSGHLLITIITPDGRDYTIYSSSIYTNERGAWMVDDWESGVPIELKPGYTILITTA